MTDDDKKESVLEDEKLAEESDESDDEFEDEDEDEDEGEEDQSHSEAKSEAEVGSGSESGADLIAEAETVTKPRRRSRAKAAEAEVDAPLDAVEEQIKLRLLEAILFASSEPLAMDVLRQQLGKKTNIEGLLTELQSHYAQHGVNLVEIGGLWSFRTAPDLAGLMKVTRQPRRKLPRAAAEVLAIIAYHQPVTRAEIESIRGVETSRGTLDILLELGWIRPGKRREVPGRPLDWQTTTEFLSHFSIASLDELPGLEDLKAAGLLDTRPVLDSLAAEKDAAETPHADDEDDDFAAWVKDEGEPEEKAVAAE